jgi:transcriptional regulator with XRE-family HTH domain
MPQKIISRVKDVMGRQGMTMRDLKEQTGLSPVIIMNACSERICYCGLNILQQIAAALNVSIKELFDETGLSKKHRPEKKNQQGGTNISHVTRQLVNLIMQMSSKDKDKLLEKFNSLNKSPSKKSDISNVTTDLIELIMKMNLAERCELLGEFIAYTGQSRRKYSRIPYLRSVYLNINNRMIQASTRDISKTGVFIDIGTGFHSFSVGDPLVMHMEHPYTSKHVRLPGKIKRIAKNGIGVEFDQPL